MNESLYVDKFYTANAEYEEIVFGKHLHDGMFVLIEDTMIRADLRNIGDNRYDQARADEMNRWCKVTQFEVIETKDYPMVKFVGVYPDGSMRVRVLPASHGWIVKRDAA